MITVYDLLMYKALGKTHESKHRYRENKNITKLQNFLDEVNTNEV